MPQKYVYQGPAKGFVIGIPAKDLTADEVAELPPEIVSLLTAGDSPMYKLVEEATEAPAIEQTEDAPLPAQVQTEDVTQVAPEVTPLPEPTVVVEPVQVETQPEPEPVEPEYQPESMVDLALQEVHDGFLHNPLDYVWQNPPPPPSIETDPQITHYDSPPVVETPHEDVPTTPEEHN